jgi:DNA-binding MarR family transcriptional regulator
MTVPPTPDQLIGILKHTTVTLVRREGSDLSARQLAVFLTCYLMDTGHTVRGLAADLKVSKPAITRALDRLGELDFARRKVDPADRRSILVQRTVKGAAFLRDLRAILSEAAAGARKGQTATPEPAKRAARG